MIRMLSERAIKMQKDVFICFIDYTKAFDRVQHKQPMHILNCLDLDGKDIRLIQNLYWEQAACMRVNNELSDYIKIERGDRQGCVFSPDLFNLYSEMILKELEGLPGFSIGGHNINNLRYADDTVLLAESEPVNVTSYYLVMIGNYHQSNVARRKVARPVEQSSSRKQEKRTDN